MNIRQLEWRLAEKECKGNNPWIGIWECVAGYDADGRKWFARSKYLPRRHDFQVWFDHDGLEAYTDADGDEYEDDFSFCRGSVVYSKDYWRAMRERHHMVRCQYEDIAKVVREFAERMNLEQ